MNKIEHIANRANQLSGSMSHGQACFAACIEMGVEKSEVPATASIVSAILTNREINFKGQSETAEQKAAQQQEMLKSRASTKANFELPGKANRDARAVRVTELLNTPAWVNAQLERK